MNDAEHIIGSDVLRDLFPNQFNGLESLQVAQGSDRVTQCELASRASRGFLGFKGFEGFEDLEGPRGPSGRRAEKM